MRDTTGIMLSILLSIRVQMLMQDPLVAAILSRSAADFNRRLDTRRCWRLPRRHQLEILLVFRKSMFISVPVRMPSMRTGGFAIRVERRNIAHLGSPNRLASSASTYNCESISSTLASSEMPRARHTSASVSVLICRSRGPPNAFKCSGCGLLTKLKVCFYKVSGCDDTIIAVSSLHAQGVRHPSTAGEMGSSSLRAN